jgi:hypothetical protein
VQGFQTWHTTRRGSGYSSVPAATIFGGMISAQQCLSPLLQIEEIGFRMLKGLARMCRARARAEGDVRQYLTYGMYTQWPHYFGAGSLRSSSVGVFISKLQLMNLSSVMVNSIPSHFVNKSIRTVVRRIR